MKRMFIVLTLGIVYVTSKHLHTIEEEKHTYVLSVLKYHYVVESVKDHIIMPLYLSHMDHDITHSDDIDRIQLKNEVMTFDVSLSSIFMSHEETKNDITYVMFEFKFVLPRFNLDMYLENVFCVLTVNDGTTYEFRIGTVEIFTTPNVFDSMWSEIQAIRHKDVISIDYIDVKTTEDVTLFMSNYIKTSTISNQNGLHMYIPKSHILYLDIPIIIETGDKKEMIVGILWLSSKRMLSQAEGYVVIYHLYKNQSRETL